MLKAPLDLSKARILVTNDDGIHAPGLKVLEKIARALSDDVWVVAPETEQSGASHSLTLRRPLRVRQLGERRFAVDGTPTDCVLLAINQMLKDRKPDLVLSGVNRGGNLGEDVTYSGTVAAAMEATLLGVPLDRAEPGSRPGSAGPVADRRGMGTGGDPPGCSVGWPRGVLVNVNFPRAGRIGAGHRGRRPGPAQDRRRPDRAHRSARPRLLLDRRDAAARTTSCCGTDLAA